MTNNVEKLPFWKLWMFAIGQFGWSLSSYAVANLISYFYMPPGEGKSSVFPPFIFQGIVIGVFTIVGLINSGGRVFDAITDPIIANLSDRSKFKMGRRKFFLAFSAIPFAFTSFLVFFPLKTGVSSVNAIWLAVTLGLFYFFLTCYCTPYNALISELGHTPDERLLISTIISITWALGFAFGNTIYAVQSGFEKSGLTSVASFQAAVGIFAVISAVFMMFPVIFIDEKKYAESHISDEGLFQAITSTFKEKNFLFFILSDLTYWVSLSFIQMGISYYITELLGFGKEFVTVLMTSMFILSFVFYVPINFVARKFGKKNVLLFAFSIFALVFLTVLFLGKLPMPKFFQAYLVVILASLPLAIFGIIPNAIVADIADAYGVRTGNYKAGIFFGARTFMMKMGISIANLLFPSFLLLGKSAQKPLGIRLSSVGAILFCISGLLLFLMYNEKEIIKTIESKGKE